VNNTNAGITDKQDALKVMPEKGTVLMAYRK